MKEFSAANCEKPKEELAVEMLGDEKNAGGRKFVSAP
jgi:hypothetical protein